VDNGQHRVDRAQALGLQTIPASYSVREEDRAAASAHAHRNGPLSPADRDQPARQQGNDPETARPPSANERNATPLWERGSTANRVRSERTRS